MQVGESSVELVNNGDSRSVTKICKIDACKYYVIHKRNIASGALPEPIFISTELWEESVRPFHRALQRESSAILNIIGIRGPHSKEFRGEGTSIVAVRHLSVDFRFNYWFSHHQG